MHQLGIDYVVSNSFRFFRSSNSGNRVVPCDIFFKNNGYRRRIFQLNQNRLKGRLIKLLTLWFQRELQREQVYSTPFVHWSIHTTQTAPQSQLTRTMIAMNKVKPLLSKEKLLLPLIELQAATVYLARQCWSGWSFQQKVTQSRSRILCPTDRLATTLAS